MPARVRCRQATCFWECRRASAFRLRRSPWARRAGCRDRSDRLHHDVETGHRILAEDAIGAGFAVGGQRTRIAALRIIGAADKGAEFSSLEVELDGAAGRALPGIAAILARRG